MNKVIEKENIKIEDMIYEIRGKQVMLSPDLANLYQCKNGTKSINLAVKRNIGKFPEDFCFKLTDEESESIWFQIETKNNHFETRGGKYNNPYVFTEEGVAMLSSVLKTEIASQISVSIMRAFVKMRKYISNELIEQKHINKMVYNLDERVTLIENTFSKFESISNEIFFEGQIYDAHSLLLDIFSTAKKNIIIIDNYISKELLDVLSKTNKNVEIYTKNINEILIKKYQKQYNNLTIKINNSFHDRFIIIDNITLYHCGASFKDLGKKCFAINKIDSREMIKELKNRL